MPSMEYLESELTTDERNFLVLTPYVEQPLIGPAKWNGRIRREISRDIRRFKERSCLATVFNSYVQDAAAGHNLPLDLTIILSANHQLTGGDGFRKKGVRVGKYRTFPRSTDVEDLVVQMLAKAHAITSPTIRAMYLQYKLIAIHPFSDGNGRTARLIASSCLLGAGFKSTLITAVERHFLHRPRDYVNLFRRAHTGLLDEVGAVRELYVGMRSRIEMIAELRRRYDAAQAQSGSKRPVENWIRNLSASRQDQLLCQIRTAHAELSIV